jgi:hypothetical protein
LVVSLALLLIIVALRPCLVVCLWPLQHRRAETIAVHEGRQAMPLKPARLGGQAILVRSAKLSLYVKVQ